MSVRALRTELCTKKQLDSSFVTHPYKKKMYFPVRFKKLRKTCFSFFTKKIITVLTVNYITFTYENFVLKVFDDL